MTAHDAKPDLRALCEAALEDDRRATPGPWRGQFRYVHLGDGRAIADTYAIEGNASFIASARTREPKLARALKRIAEICDEHDFDAFERVEAIREVLDGQ